MNREYERKAPLVRFAIAVAAVSMTISLGGFIELLASSYATNGEQAQLVVPGSQEA